MCVYVYARMFVCSIVFEWGLTRVVLTVVRGVGPGIFVLT